MSLKVLAGAGTFKQKQKEEESTLEEGGLQAWLCVLSGAIINGIVFGNVHVWGVYQSYYMRYFEQGNVSVTNLSMIGSLACALVYGFGPFVGKASQTLGARPVMTLGAILLPLGIYSASFTTQVWELWITQGIMFGCGGSLVFIPSLPIIAQWFNLRRAFATGLAVSGVGLGGLALAPFTEGLLTRQGRNYALRANALVSLVLLLFAVFISKEKTGPKMAAKSIIPDLAFLKRTEVMVLTLIGCIYAFGYVLPYYFFPTILLSIGISPANAAKMIGMMSALNALGRIVLGRLADQVGRVKVLFGTCLITSIACLIMWPLVTNLTTASIFGITYGFTAGSYWSLFPVVIAQLVPMSELHNANGVVYFSITIGQLVGPIFAAMLFDIRISTQDRYLLGKLYTGAIFALATLFAAWLLKLCLATDCVTPSPPPPPPVNKPTTN